jgi:2,4-dienoyl-CoA reductase-like NADH-dependent reductase (Old Yellow Enzyme family)/coenzyme F420-reducing hydrogenase delta subunit
MKGCFPLLKLFTPIKVGSIELPNRIMMSPMFSNSATREGFVTDNTIRHYLTRARSRVGLIMVEHTSVNAHYLHPGNRLLISDDKYIKGLNELAASVQETGSLVGLQIAHSIYAADKTPADLTKEEVYEIIDDFVSGALRAKEAGFDVIEIHLAHTYTLADFISRRTNRRRDEYGKGIEGRFQIIKEIIARLRSELGETFPLFARFSADEFIIGGNSLRQTRYYAREMERLGIDCLDVSCGVRFDDGGLRGYSDLRGKPTVQMNDGANVYLAEDIKKQVSIPVIAVGKLGNPDFAEKVLQEGKADIIALARQFIADPLWVEKVRSGRKDTIYYCRYCNNCLYKRRDPNDPIVCLDIRECANCLTCLRICPFEVPFINEDGKLEFDNEMCEECGLCKGICPTRLVRFDNWPAEDIVEKINETTEKHSSGLRTLVFGCKGDIFKDVDIDKDSELSDGMSLIKVSCISKLETLHYLHALSKGIQKIIVAGCQEDKYHECSFHRDYRWVDKRIDRAKKLTAESGFGNNKIFFVKIEAMESKKTLAALKDHISRVIKN